MKERSFERRSLAVPLEPPASGACAPVATDFQVQPLTTAALCRDDSAAGVWVDLKFERWILAPRLAVRYAAATRRLRLPARAVQ